MDWNQIIGGGFVVGSIFWAGATYSRIGRIEEDMKKLILQLGGLSELGLMKASIKTHNEEIVLLRKAVFGDQWQRYGGPHQSGHE